MVSGTFCPGLERGRRQTASTIQALPAGTAAVAVSEITPGGGGPRRRIRQGVPTAADATKAERSYAARRSDHGGRLPPA